MVIVTAEQIRRSGAHDIPGVLRQVTGLDVMRWTNNGPDLAVRGYNQAFSPRLLVLVNGRQVYADHYGYTPWSMLPVELGEIRQIEVVKGPNSALFGFNAVGGVINIITFDPGDDDPASVELRAGTQRHRQAALAGGFELGERGRVRVSAGLRRNEDFSTPTTPGNQATRLENERKSLRLDAHFDLRENLELEVEASWNGGLLTNMIPAYLMAYEDMVVKSVMANLAADTALGLTHVSAYRNWIDNDAYLTVFDFTTLNNTLPAAPIAVFDNEVTVVQFQQVFKAGTNHTFRLSGEYRDSSLATTPVTGGTVHYDVLAAGAMWQWQLLPDLTLTLAARHDMLDLGRRGSIPAGLGLTNADWDRSVNKTSYNGGLVWAVNPGNTLRLTSARGVQLPSLFNLGGSLTAYPIPPEFGPPPVLYSAGLPSLEPVTVTNHELAWDSSLSALNAELRLAWFRGETRKVIADAAAFDYARGILSAPGNIGDSRTSGVELSLKGTIGEQWRWGAGYLHQDVDDNFAAEIPLWISLVDFAQTTSRHITTASLGWTGGAWEADVFVRYQSARHGLRPDPTFVFDFLDPTKVPEVLTELPGYASADARVGYRFGERLILSLAAQNLFTGEQRQTSGAQVERRVLGTVNYTF
jgi:iron complex outermembrane receptor protein